MTSTEGMDALGRILGRVDRVLLTTHEHPDGDAIGSVLALRRMLRASGKSAEIVLADTVPEKYRFLIDEPVPLPGDPEWSRRGNDTRYPLLITVDVAAPDRIGPIDDVLDRLLESDAVRVTIDHHLGDRAFGDIQIVDVERASAGELVLVLAQRLGFSIDPIIANQLYAALITDTGRFQYANANAASFRAAAELVEAGADPVMVADRIYHDRPVAYVQLLGRLLCEMELWCDGRIALLVLTEELVRARSSGTPVDTEGIVDHTVQMRGVVMGALLRQIGPHAWRVSLRSRGTLNVRLLAESFGGGGHDKAAGCRLEGTLEVVKRRLIEQMEGCLRDGSC